MTRDEKTSIINTLDGLELLDIQEIFISFYSPTQSDIDTTIVLGQFSVGELIVNTRRIISIIRKEINSPGWSSLPSHVQHNDLGNRHFISELSSLFSLLNNRHFDMGYLMSLEWLIFYARTNNFWHLNENVTKLENINRVENLILSKNEIYGKSIREFELLKADVQRSFSEMEALINDKTKSLQVLTDAATSSTSTLNGMNESLIESRSKRDLIAEVLTNANNISEESKSRIDEERKKFEEHKRTLEDIEKSFK